MRNSCITIGTRGSQLSLAQTDIVRHQLQELFPATNIIVKVIKTMGDKNMAPIPLDTIGKGWFTKEIDQQLLNGDIDLAVHSLKDIPDELPHGLIIASIPQREDAREALVSKNNIPFAKLKKGAIIGTDSARRKSQLLYKRSDLIIKSLRGNVNTRLQKLDNNEYDAICLAVAGLKRLHLESRISEYFDEIDIVPSPGQGALAIVIRERDRNLLRILRRINDPLAQRAITSERTFSQSVGGGCKMPIGAYARIDGKEIILHGFIGSPDGKYHVVQTIKGPAAQPVSIGKQLAAQLLLKSKTWYRIKNSSIVVTRPFPEMKEFSDHLREIGYTVFTFPTIRVAKKTLLEKEKNLLKALDDFGWLVFTSSNGVRFFIQTINKLGISPKVLQTKKIGVVGPKTAKEVKKNGLTISFVPSRFTTEQLARELPKITNKKILLPRANIANKLLTKILTERGALVTTIPIYQTEFVKHDNSLLIKSIEDKKIAAITFTSPSTIHGFMKNFNRSIREKVLPLPVISIGPVTSATAKEYGFRSIYTADTYTIEGMLKTLQEHIV